MTASKEHATVHTACEVSFRVGHMDYGTILVPVGTNVFRHVIKSKDAYWKPETVKYSDWFLEADGIVYLCPKEHMQNRLYLDDALNYGITVPNANVKKDSGTPSEKHKAFHY
jgi:hypothetical protein